MSIYTYMYTTFYLFKFIFQLLSINDRIVRLAILYSLTAQLYKKLLKNSRQRRITGRGTNHDGNQDILFG